MFQLQSKYVPTGDQPSAIEKIVKGIQEAPVTGRKGQVLLGVTGSGKTFTMANVIQHVQRPTLVIAHNKTLAAQLYQEFKQFFPDNAVEYFVSYYDYYQPEAYIPRTDTYIEKDFAINDKIDKMRLSATRSLLEREDVIIVASVSCIYGLGIPEYYRKMNLILEVGSTLRRDDLLFRLVEMQYKRSDMELVRASFRSRGDIVEVFPAYEEDVSLRIEFFGDEIETIIECDPLTGKKKRQLSKVVVWPSSHYVTPEEVRYEACQGIEEELHERREYFLKQDKLIEAQRIQERVKYDLEMIREVGFCKGIENYSRHFSERPVGAPPPCLIDYFPEDYLLIIDESHQTIPQLGAMSHGDKARKSSLVEFGFRLPSAYDNRPLTFEEVQKRFQQVLFVSATPGPWERQFAGGELIEQIIRPTGLLDPKIEVRPAQFQVDDCLEEIKKETENGGKVLVTTLTKHLAEELTRYLKELGCKAAYIHSDIDTLERLKIIHDLRTGVYDVLIGINLLREGLDIPEVQLVVILDADKEGFLRSETSLIQTCGRAARNVHGRVIMYADKITKSMERTLVITERRRALQEEYNKKHGITPRNAAREVTLLEVLQGELQGEKAAPSKSRKPLPTSIPSADELMKKIAQMEVEMKKAAKELQFEVAINLRDSIKQYKQILLEYQSEDGFHRASTL